MEPVVDSFKTGVLLEGLRSPVEVERSGVRKGRETTKGHYFCDT